MANAQVNIRVIEEARGDDFGAKCPVWTFENVRFAIGTLIIEHVWRESTLRLIFLQKWLVYIVCAICSIWIYSLCYTKYVLLCPCLSLF